MMSYISSLVETYASSDRLISCRNTQCLVSIFFFFLLLLALQPTMGFSLLSDSLPFCSLFAYLLWYLQSTSSLVCL